MAQPEPARESSTVQRDIRVKDATKDTSVGRVATKLEVIVIPVSDVDRAKEFYGKLVGGSTPTSPAVTTSACSSSRHLALGARSSSARTSPRRRPALRRACT